MYILQNTPKVSIVVIMTCVFFVPEAKPKDKKCTVVIIAIRYFNKDHILMAWSEAEDNSPIKSHILILPNTLKVLNALYIPAEAGR